HLPGDIVEEILSRLPVKSLLRFKCVSKSCRSLIRSDRFIKRHLEKSKSGRRLECWEVIFGNFKSPNLKRCSLLSYLDDPSVTPLLIDDPITNHLTVDSQIIGHSNGLLCIFNKPNSFFLWNPATRFSLQLPKPDADYVIKCGFGWDGDRDAYKVFAVFSKMNGNGIKRIGSIYNSKTNSWKALERASTGALICAIGLGSLRVGKYTGL
ncbi:F-box/kelch-repeat protein At3g23880-like, partial [Salvia hispanica]|uniref:F-box/kelch-repeat protein At3g23880-like n=1 Tax=Salvia hispanica TaxID=49212 RepID=UPI0020099B05